MKTILPSVTYPKLPSHLNGKYVFKKIPRFYLLEIQCRSSGVEPRNYICGSAPRYSDKARLQTSFRKMAIGTVYISTLIEAIFIYKSLFRKLAVFERMMKTAGLE